jgi:hypothetical protein
MIPSPQQKKIIEEALKFVSEGPYTAEDLVKARAVITDEFCARHGQCESPAVLDWLDSLDTDQLEDVLFEVNADWSAGQERWALGSG